MTKFFYFFILEGSVMDSDLLNPDQDSVFQVNPDPGPVMLEGLHFS
jgi:hypothetical protein